MKTNDSHYTQCKTNEGAASVVKYAASSGLQCKDDLVKDDIAGTAASRNSQCETSAGTTTLATYAASSGLQCTGQLVRDNSTTSNVSHNHQRESSMASTAGMKGCSSHTSQCEDIATENLHMADNSKNYQVRYVYNSGVIPRQVDALLARKPRKGDCNIGKVKNRTVLNSRKHVQEMVFDGV